jgi:hypothetical protein
MLYMASGSPSSIFVSPFAAAVFVSSASLERRVSNSWDPNSSLNSSTATSRDASLATLRFLVVIRTAPFLAIGQNFFESFGSSVLSYVRSHFTATDV